MSVTVRSGQGRKRRRRSPPCSTLRRSLTPPSAGISHSTLSRWLREEGFLGEYRLAQREALPQAIATLQAAAGSAVTVLRAAMLDPTATAASRSPPPVSCLSSPSVAPRWPTYRSAWRPSRPSSARRAGRERPRLREPLWRASRRWRPPSASAVPIGRNWSPSAWTRVAWGASTRSPARTGAAAACGWPSEAFEAFEGDEAALDAYYARHGWQPARTILLHPKAAQRTPRRAGHAT